MFKKGQLVICNISMEYYEVLHQHGLLLAVRNLSNGDIGWMNSQFVALIGNNYTAKDSKKSVPSSR
ncbi:hypothetical protein QA051_gp01 [Salmonella phage celemicas]|uniref:Uncharacterized protein n=1 Tax=Salmonella phage celemicas TaxID=2713289 RepID=A0A6G8RQW8_9CAUD|nr:hypothetical protein QA051_gp01 [Salmonella phage celemicas]EBZ5579280.1 hypothetical protein [Salmonella enterica subsp. enterica serovar Enteritidis]QIO03793.1 hypothetical protein celemicas_1 [Salmonella phage celemicas]